MKIVTRKKTRGRNISLYLEGPLYIELSQIAKAKKITVSKVIKEKLTGQSPDSLYDRIKDIIGTIEGPSDLSTNPKYMEGFGQDMKPARARRK